MTDRCQLNLRLDGRRDLLESCKEVAAAQGLSLNAWVVKQLELGVTGTAKSPTVSTARQPLDNVVDTTRQALDTVEAIEAPGKSDAGNSEELPKVDNEVAERLQNELSNLKAENEKIKYDYNTLTIISQQLNQQLEEVTADRAKLLESSIQIKTKLERQVQELRSQLATERADREEVEAKLTDREEQMRQLLSELSDLKQKSAIAGEPNQLSLPDLKAIYEVYKQEKKKEGKPGRTFNVTELKPFYVAMLKLLTPDKGN